MTVWLLKVPAGLRADMDARLLSLMTPDRRERVRRMGRDKLRRTHMAAYVLEAYAVSRSSGLPIAELRRGTGPHGKPYFKNLPTYRYNLSHSDDWVMLGEGREEIGVDIERIRPFPSRVAARYFTGEERAYAREHGGDAGAFAIWTRKEAAVKWEGRGLSAALLRTDTLSGARAPLLHTFYQPEFVASVCTKEPFSPAAVRHIALEDLLQAGDG